MVAVTTAGQNHDPLVAPSTRKPSGLGNIGILPKGNNRDNTTSLLIPDDTDQDCTLSPLTRYGYRVFEPEEEKLLGRGVFETVPDLPASTPSRFSIALFSCHQPFTQDGGVHEAAGPMLMAFFNVQSSK